MSTRHDRADRLRTLARTVVESYETHGGINRIGEKTLPSQAAIVDVLNQLLTIVFPGYYGGAISTRRDLELLLGSRLDALHLQLQEIVDRTLQFCHREPCRCSAIWPEGSGGEPLTDFTAISGRIALDYLEGLPAVRQQLKEDVQAAYEGDPAAVNTDEVILCYPGTFAIAVHRLAHPLYRVGVPLVPRIMSEWAHHRTGVDIHPGARIGSRFFIDHGTGVVIGETTRIGDRVKIYQGVTLGALSFPRNPDGSLVKGGKRHPTIEDEVTIYANATILGGETVVGRGAVIGGGTWITASVPAGAKVTIASTTSAVRP
jgi:serine O-acetyltransferase